MAKFRDLSKSNKELSDRTTNDRLLHQQALREALKRNLADIIIELDIFKVDRISGKKYKIPVQLLEEFRFVYDESGEDNTNKVGQKANPQKGEVIEGPGESRDKKVTGIAGDQHAEITVELSQEDIDFVLTEVSKDLKLPFLAPQKSKKIKTRRKSRWRGIRENGIEPRLDIEASFVEKIKRQNMLRRLNQRTTDLDSDSADIPFIGDDLRYHGLGFKTDKQSNALIMFIMDISGSMNKDKRYFVKSFLYAAHCLILANYPDSETVFIVHDTEATEIDSDTFFKTSSGGGTKISSGPRKAMEIIKQRFSANLLNIYVVHCSDGENQEEDDPRTIEIFKELLEISSLIGFIEVKPGTPRFSDTAGKLARAIKDPRLRVLFISRKEEVSQKFMEFLEPDPELFESGMKNHAS